jgi:predicted P-loop ATPase
MWEKLAAPWFTDSPLNVQDKSALEIMLGNWIVELGEMETIIKYESATVKGFFSRNCDRFRMAYERKAKDFPRKCIFVGSLNPEQTGWLKDHTGNRRYWPVPVGNINLAGITEDRNQLWAEARVYFEQGETIHVADEHMRAIMQGVVDARLQEDPWFSIVESWMRLEKNVEPYLVDDRLEVLPVDLYSSCIGGGAAAFGSKEMSRMCTILKSLGFERVRARGMRGSVYVKEWRAEL